MPLGDRLFDPSVVSEPRGGGFREHLDLSGIVDRFEVLNPNYKPAEPREEWAKPGEGEPPERAGIGPLTASTCRSLALAGPQWAWDPNRYYRDLGIGWPYVHATKKDLREAYQAVDGQASDRLTYCFKQLLTIRTWYDALPLGELWMDDIYVQERMAKRAAAEASRRTAMGKHTRDEDVLDEWGYTKLTEDESKEVEAARRLDEDRSKRLNQPSQLNSVGADWHYSFYLWKTTEADLDRLAAWQSGLISAVDPEVIPTLTVGMMGKQPQDYVIAKVGDTWVVFLHHKAEVSPDLVRKAVSTLHNDYSRG